MVKQNFLTKMLLLCALIVGSVSSAWAADVTIASGTFEKTTYTTGWTCTGTGKKTTGCIIIGKDEYIETPTLNLSSYSKITISITARRYGSLSGSKATIAASIGGTQVGSSVDATSTSVSSLTDITFIPTESMTSSVIRFTCTNATSAGSTHGAGIGSITITGTKDGETIVYTVTYNANGATSGTVPVDENEYEANDEVTVLGNTGNLAKDHYTFNGWNTKADGSGTGYVAGGTFAISDNTTLYAKWKLDGDMLNRAFTGVTDGTTSYSDWSGKTGESGAVYAGNSAGSHDAIQLRSSNNSGIVTTTSGGEVKKVTVVWNSNTTNGRTIDIYGKSTAYSAASDLYNSNNQGTMIGSIVYGTSTSLTIEDDYEYIGIRSHDGALYLDQIVIKWEASNKTATTTTIDATGITNTDVYVNTAAGTLSATVTAGGNEVSGATVTWSSSDENVATINENGVVTLVAAGTTTITASYEGNDTYQSSSATYELEVTSSAPYVQPTNVTIQMTNSLFGQDVHTSGEAAEDMTFVGKQDNVTVTYFVPEGSYYYFNTSNTRPYNTCTLTYGAPTGYVITKIDFTSDGQNWKTATPSVGEMTGTKVWEGSAESVTFSWKETGTRVKTVVVTLAKSAKISSYKWATFSSDKALDFTDSDVKAYIVTGFEGTSITKKQVYVVPANTGLLLNAEEGGTYGIPVATGETNDVSENKLHAVLGGSQTVSEGTGSDVNYDVNYVLSVKNEKVVFAWIGSTSATVKDGQAYLTLKNGPKPDSGNAPWLSIEGDDETTGIQSIERTMNDNQYYTLDGRRVAEPTKGLYIVNGKKVVIK